jgi:lysyl-tRNA synthetase class I
MRLERTELEEANDKQLKQIEELVETARQYRCKISSMNIKVEMKQYVADEAEKDKKALEKKLEALQHKYNEL